MKTYKIEWELHVKVSAFIKKGPRWIVDKYVSSGSVIDFIGEERDQKRRIVGVDEIGTGKMSDIPGIVFWKYNSLSDDWHIHVFRADKFTMVPNCGGSENPIIFACFEVEELPD